jgi:MarR family transcriptional regulator, organic hydroperoxide resistance regulator
VKFATSSPSVPAPLEQRLFVALLETADDLGQEAEQLIKSGGLTAAQHNVLRILRGARPLGLACRSIGDRMISHDPDMTRLLDRLEKRGLITRKRQNDDRRVVKTHITPQGLEVLKPLDHPLRELHKRQFRHISVVQLKMLSKLLEEVRAHKR